MIAAHGGGSLVDRTLHGTAGRTAYEEAHALARIELSERGLADFECISTGVYSPLEGFGNVLTFEPAKSPVPL